MVTVPAVIQNIFFDLDGTLVDSLPGIEYSMNAAFSRSGLRPQLVPSERLIGPPIRSILRRITPENNEEALDRLEREFRTVYDSLGWQMTTCYAGATEMLAQLRRRGKILFLVTYKPLHATQKIIKYLGIDSQFSAVLTRDSRKPPFASKAEMLLFLLEDRHLSPGVCLMVGDTVEDYSAAAEVGIAAAVLAHGYGVHHVPGGLPNCAKLNDFQELLSLCFLNGERHD